MDEVDRIIFQNLKSLGWECEQDTEALRDLDINDIASGLVRCLKAINEETNIPNTFPHNMTERFRAAASIAEAVKVLGYVGDVGYQSILYPNEIELRKLFMFLIEKMPKDSPALQKEPLGRKESLYATAKAKISASMSRPWVPLYCWQVACKMKNSSKDISSSVDRVPHPTNFTSTTYHTLGLPHSEMEQLNLSEDEPHLLDQVSEEVLYPTLLNAHAIQMGTELSNSQEKPWSNLPSGFDDCTKTPSLKLLPLSENWLRFLSGERKIRNVVSSSPQLFEDDSLSTINKDLMAENKQNIIEKRDSLQKEVFNLSRSLKVVISDIKKEESYLQEFEEEIIKMKKAINCEEKVIENSKKASLLGDDPKESIQRLHMSLNASQAKEEKLRAQWLEYKEPLEDELGQLTQLASEKKSEKEELLEEISEIRSKMKFLASDANKKENLLKLLKKQQESIKEGKNRSVYTKRILDISAKVRKQKEEVDKVINDMKKIQKEINSLAGKLQRTFVVVENTSFKASSSNEKARQIYRTVVSIHEMCGELSDIVRDTGITQREIADFQQQLNAEKNKKVEDVLQQLQEDFSQLKSENSELKRKFSGT